MAISVDWATKVITVPKADTTLVDIGPPEIRSLDVDQFRKDLNALQAAEEGMPFQPTHTHNPPVTVGGVTLARVVEIINGYTVTFENGAYAVSLTGANNNISDVTNLNTVSIRSANSAGLIEASIGASIMTEDYPVDGQSSATVAQMLYSINQMLSEFARSGTTVSIKKRDGTEAFQLTLDSATAPTTSTQST